MTDSAALLKEPISNLPIMCAVPATISLAPTEQCTACWKDFFAPSCSLMQMKPLLFSHLSVALWPCVSSDTRLWAGCILTEAGAIGARTDRGSSDMATPLDSAVHTQIKVPGWTKKGFLQQCHRRTTFFCVCEKSFYNLKILKKKFLYKECSWKFPWILKIQKIHLRTFIFNNENGEHFTQLHFTQRVCTLCFL